MIIDKNKEVKNYIVEVICLLYILLFIYAAVSKLLDFEEFQVQLGQSPLLSSFAQLISWLVPLIEIAVALLLMFPKSRKAGLFASLSLMTMFTAYIFIILHYGSFVPCSCGGILEKMSWNAHLYFNIVFVLFAVIAILLNEHINVEKAISYTVFKSVKTMFAISFVSMGLILILFLCSEQIMHHKNPFIRRYIKGSVQFVNSKDLKFNSYYFSGSEGNTIYLGNYTAPLNVLALDTTFKISKIHRINFNDRSVPFRLIKIIVKSGHFYLTDGRVPCVYRGSSKNWKLETEFKGVPIFTSIQPIDSTSFVFRNNAGVNSANILGVYSANKSTKIHYTPALLEKQIDGIFDTDGMLLFSNESDKIIFTYFYRNEFVVANKNAVLLKRGKTIDTITKAKIKVAVLRDGKRLKLAAPPLIVNAKSTTKNNLLFIESKIPGSYEDEVMWSHASVIDVYNIKDNSYILSFPIFEDQKNKLRSIYVTNTHFFVIIGTKVVMYKLRGILKNEMNAN